MGLSLPPPGPRLSGEPLGAVMAVLCVLAGCSCTPQGDPGIGESGFTDDFEGGRLAEHWHNTGGPYEVRGGQLRVRGAHNKPLWLRRTLPRDVRVEFEATSYSTDGDIKAEICGDGASAATEDSYTASSYVVIFGGWNNTKNLIARLDEHGDDRVEGRVQRIESEHTYHVRIERRGNTVQSYLDDQLITSFEDQDPLEGRGHNHFAFNNWESDLAFDNLTITPL